MGVYSFSDVSMTISHPAVGQFLANGAGVGSITVSMSTDRTTHDVAADGRVMVSKVKGRNGSIAIAVQQDSELNRWLTKLFNYLDFAPASVWADIRIILRSPSMQELVTATSVSFQKLADKPYQSQGQQLSWNLMAGDIQQDIQ